MPKMSVWHDAQIGLVDEHLEHPAQLTSYHEDTSGALHNHAKGQGSYTPNVYHATYHPMTFEDARNLYRTGVAYPTQHVNYHHYMLTANPYQMNSGLNPFFQPLSGFDASNTRANAFNSGLDQNFQLQEQSIRYHHPSPMASPALAFVQRELKLYNQTFRNTSHGYSPTFYPNMELHVPTESTKPVIENPGSSGQEVAYATPPATPGEDAESDTGSTSSSPQPLTLELVSPLLKGNVEDASDVDETWTLHRSGSKDLWPPPSYVSWLSKKPAYWAQAYLNASDNPTLTPQEVAERDVYRYRAPKDTCNTPYFVEGEPGMGYTFTNCQLVEVISPHGTKKVIERIHKEPMFFCWSCGKGVGAARGTPKDIIRHLGVHGNPSWSCKAVGCKCDQDLTFRRQERLYKHCRSVDPHWNGKKPYTRRVRT